MDNIILASDSQIRARLLTQAEVPFDVCPAKIDESQIKESMSVSGAHARDIADALAEGKARKVSSKFPESLVLGCDQVLEHDGDLLSKPKSKTDAIDQLLALSGKRHSLFSAGVIYEGGKPVWRHVGHVRLWVRQLSEDWIEQYVDRNWNSIQYSVGGYKIEEEGVRLFTKVDGDFFHALGIPLLEVLSYLTLRGTLRA